MRYPLLTVFAVFGLGLVPHVAFADLAPPPPAAKEVKFVVEVDEKAKGSKLIVPQTLVNPRFRPAPGGGVPKEGNGGLAVLEYEVEGDAAVEPARNRNHLMIAGVAFTLALGLGGIWIVRRTGRSGARGLALLVAAGGVLAVSTVVWANAGPPPKPKEKKEVMLLPVAFDGKLTLEMVRGGDTIKLVLDKEAYDAIKTGPKKPEGK